MNCETVWSIVIYESSEEARRWPETGGRQGLESFFRVVIWTAYVSRGVVPISLEDRKQLVILLTRPPRRRATPSKHPQATGTIGKMLYRESVNVGWSYRQPLKWNQMYTCCIPVVYPGSIRTKLYALYTVYGEMYTIYIPDVYVSYPWNQCDNVNTCNVYTVYIV